MFKSGSVSVFNKISALRARISAVGAPSERALYERKSNQNTHVSLERPMSVSTPCEAPHNLQRDSAYIIRGNLYSASRS